MNSVELEGMSPESPGILENPDWTPAINLRPHHVLNFNRLINADNDESYYWVYRVWSRIALDGGVTRDTFGTSNTEIRENLKTKKIFFDFLQELPDESVVHLDLKPDNICKACTVGQHCTATNYNAGFFGLWGSPDAMKGEQNAISEIQSTLVENGYQEGKDFIFKVTNHVLYDYEGSFLNDVNNPHSLDVSFKSMLVKMSAIRTVIQTTKE